MDVRMVVHMDDAARDRIEIIKALGLIGHDEDEPKLGNERGR